MAALNSHFILYFLLRERRLLSYSYRKRRARALTKQKRRQFWVRWLYEERIEKGEFNLLVRDLKLYNHCLFFKYFRMLPATFEKLLRMVAVDIKKCKTKMRDPICPEQRLAITLRYLATGDAHTTIGTNYRMSPTTVGRIVPETCNAIWVRLNEAGKIQTPTNAKQWKGIADEFESRWNFPHAIGAIDGKHVVMFAPANQGSSYFNYKKTHSIVLMAACDAKYKFTLVDIGDSGRQSDGSVYANSHLGYAIENNLLGIPTDSKFTNGDRVLPYVFVADDAFGLKRHMMKPYPSGNLDVPKQIFNYRLSRARRVIENAFGILASRFRVFHKPIIAQVHKVIAITKAAVALHNFLMHEKE